MLDIVIDEELKNLIPALSQPEFEQLENNILEEGCREAVIVWNGILVDGHNRHEICRKNNIDFKIAERTDFSNREEVIDWMINNQIGKRNLTPGTISYLRGLKFKREKYKALENINNDSSESLENNTAEEQSDKQELTIDLVDKPVAEKIAKQYRVTEKTIKKDEKFTDAVDTITTNAGEEIKDKILNREIDINSADVMIIAELEPEEQKIIMKAGKEEIKKKVKETRKLKKGDKKGKNHMKAELIVDELNEKITGFSFVLNEGDGNFFLDKKIKDSDDEEIYKTFKNVNLLLSFLEGFRDAIEMNESK